LGRALLLNASFEPLCVVPMRRAVVLVLKEKAEIVARNGAVVPRSQWSKTTLEQGDEVEILSAVQGG